MMMTMEDLQIGDAECVAIPKSARTNISATARKDLFQRWFGVKVSFALRIYYRD